MRDKAKREGKVDPLEGLISLSFDEPRKIPSKKWRELIKKVWEVDPLECPKCGGEMKIIALIDDSSVIEKILRHLGLWEEKNTRAPPSTKEKGTVINLISEQEDLFPDEIQYFPDEIYENAYMDN